VFFGEQCNRAPTAATTPPLKAGRTVESTSGDSLHAAHGQDDGGDLGRSRYTIF
jgi:hypothetical protein